jgi:exopolysaccharide production protein ExoZ
MILHGIQLIRGIAATMVVVFHVGRMLLFKTGVDVTLFTTAGAAGVDLFFVVSGFIMIYTTGRRDFSPSDFLYRRLVRVAPLYWLMTLLYGAVALAVPAGFFSYQLDVFNFAAAFAFIPSYNSKGGIFPPLTQGWTLVYEMFFYVALAAASRVLFATRIPLLIGLFSALVLAGLISPSHNAARITYTDPILFEFLMGCVLAELLIRDRLRFGPNVAVALIVIGAVVLVAGTVFSDLPRLRVLYWGIPSLLVVLGMVRAERFFDFGAFRIGQAIGDSSYSLYLSHLFVLSALALIFKLDVARAWGGVPLVPFLMLACLTAGWLCWRYVERPMTSGLMSLRRKKRIDHTLPQGLPRHVERVETSN